MMPLHAPGPLQPAIRPNVLNLAAFQRRPGKAPVTKARDPRIVYLRTEDQKHDRPSKLFDYFAAASIVMSAAFGPAVMWLLVR
jgi:hypothetical protein